MKMSVGAYVRIRYMGDRILSRAEAARACGISYGTARLLDKKVEQQVRPLAAAVLLLLIAESAEPFVQRIDDYTAHMESLMAVLTGRKA